MSTNKLTPQGALHSLTARDTTVVCASPDLTRVGRNTNHAHHGSEDHDKVGAEMIGSGFIATRPGPSIRLLIIIWGSSTWQWYFASPDHNALTSWWDRTQVNWTTLFSKLRRNWQALRSDLVGFQMLGFTAKKTAFGWRLVVPRHGSESEAG